MSEPVVRSPQPVYEPPRASFLSSVEIIELQGTPGDKRYGFRQPAVVSAGKEAMMLGWNDETYRLYVFPKWMSLNDFYDMVLIVEQSLRGYWAAAQLQVTSLQPDL